MPSPAFPALFARVPRPIAFDLARCVCWTRTQPLRNQNTQPQSWCIRYWCCRLFWSDPIGTWADAACFRRAGRMRPSAFSPSLMASSEAQPRVTPTLRIQRHLECLAPRRKL
eukprot:1990503-Rhodomonas_salina.1